MGTLLNCFLLRARRRYAPPDDDANFVFFAAKANKHGRKKKKKKKRPPPFLSDLNMGKSLEEKIKTNPLFSPVRPHKWL